MGIFKFVKITRIENLMLKLIWKDGKFSIYAREIAKGQIKRKRVNKVTANYKIAISIYEHLCNELTDAESLKELYTELESKYNMLKL